MSLVDQVLFPIPTNFRRKNPDKNVGNIGTKVGATVGISRPSQRDMPNRFEAGSKIRQNLPAVAYRAKSLGISRCDGRDMPTVAPTFVPIATVGELQAESWQNPPDLENQFLHRWMCYSLVCCFKTAGFLTEKRIRDH
jgi:hypothetical protein